MVNIDPTPLFVLIPVIIGLIAITQTLADNRTRRRAIEARLSEEAMHAVFARDPEAYGALKWGLVSVAVGAAIIVAQSLGFDFYQPMVYGLMLLFGGAALLLYYRLALRLVQRQPTSSSPLTPAEPQR